MTRESPVKLVVSNVGRRRIHRSQVRSRENPSYLCQWSGVDPLCPNKKLLGAPSSQNGGVTFFKFRPCNQFLPCLKSSRGLEGMHSKDLCTHKSQEIWSYIIIFILSNFFHYFRNSINSDIYIAFFFLDRISNDIHVRGPLMKSPTHSCPTFQYKLPLIHNSYQFWMHSTVRWNTHEISSYFIRVNFVV